MKRYASVCALISSAVIVSAIVAIAWPFTGTTIQPNFFIAVASTVLTIFGLVFTLCIIGTQIASATGHVNARHVFNVWTWLYLILFLLAALWSLGIGYNANEPRAGVHFYLKAGKLAVGIDQVSAGRIAIFGIGLCFVLLLPFIRVTFVRISAEGIFEREAKAVYSSRSDRQLDHRLHRITNTIGSMREMHGLCERGVVSLLYAAAARVTRNKALSRASANEVARQVTSSLGKINYLLRNTPSGPAALDAQQRWIIWLIMTTRSRNRKDRFPLCYVDANQVATLTRDTLDVAEANLRQWRIDVLPVSTATKSAKVALGIASSSILMRPCPNLVRLSAEFAACVVERARSGGPILNLFLRGLCILVRLGIQIGPPETSKLIWGEFSGAITAILSPRSNSRPVVPQWIIYEIHNLFNFASTNGGVADSTLRALVGLTQPELVKLLKGPPEMKDREGQGNCLIWQERLGHLARELDSHEQYALICSETIKNAILDDNLPIALRILRNLIRNYGDRRNALAAAIVASARLIRTYLEENPELFDAPGPRRKRTRYGRPVAGPT